MGHQLPIELDLVASIDRYLPIERKAVGILRDGDLARSASVGMPPSMMCAGAEPV